jgi:tetratricopeptide (TPR) repeat protein
MATLLELAKDAFKNHNYILSCEIYERLLRESGSRKTTELYFGYGDSLAKCDRIKEALDIYAHICYQLCEIIPVEKLKCLASSIIEFIVNKRTNIIITTTSSTTSNVATNNINNSSSNNDSHLSTNVDNNGEFVDALYCPICEDILKYPVTSLCGHTFCRECCFGRTKCIVCGQKFPIINTTMQQDDKSSASVPTTSSHTLATTVTSTAIAKNSTITSDVENGSNHEMDIYSCSDNDERCGGFEQDILVRRLIEKWWSPHLKAAELNDEAENYLHRDMHDEALKCCNQSLELGEFNQLCALAKKNKLITNK